MGAFSPSIDIYISCAYVCSSHTYGRHGQAEATDLPTYTADIHAYVDIYVDDIGAVRETAARTACFCWAVACWCFTSGAMGLATDEQSSPDRQRHRAAAARELSSIIPGCRSFEPCTRIVSCIYISIYVCHRAPHTLRMRRYNACVCRYIDGGFSGHAMHAASILHGWRSIPPTALRVRTTG